MKLTISLALLLTPSLLAQTGPETPDLTSLRTSWSRARTAATEPIDRKYLAALGVLKDKLTKAGNLEGALQVDSEIKKLSGVQPTASNPTSQTEGVPVLMTPEIELLVGKWIGVDEQPPYNPHVINGDGTASHFDGKIKGTWTLQEGYMLIKWPNVVTKIKLGQKGSKIDVVTGAKPLEWKRHK